MALDIGDELLRLAEQEPDAADFVGELSPGDDKSNQDGRHPCGDLLKINTSVRDLAHLAEQAWDAVMACNDPPRVFQYGGYLARIKKPVDAGATVELFSEAALRGHLARTAEWVTSKWVSGGKDKEGYWKDAPTFPLREVVQDMLADPEIPVPILNRIVETPVFSDKGMLVTEPGFHRESGIWLHREAGLKIFDIPKKPDRNEVEGARDYILCEMIPDFPFVSPSDRAHAVAALILPFVRAMIKGPTPLHAFDATSPGTGKSLLSDVIAMVGTGRNAEMMTEPRDEEEMRKRLTAILSGSPTFVVVDNVIRRIDSGTLAACLTSVSWKDRVLGKSKMIMLPVNCGWMTTGNNIRMSLEIARRTIRCRMDAKVEQPWLRTDFRQKDLRIWVKENRGTLISAVLIMVQAWIAEGRPYDGPTLGMYEEWAQVVGGVLQVTGIEGFLGNLQQMYSTADEETALWRDFCTAWWNAFGTRIVSVGELYKLAVLNDYLLPVLGDKGERSQKTRLGRALGNMCERKVGSWQVDSARPDARSGVRNYKLTYLNGDAGVDDYTPGVIGSDSAEDDLTASQMEILERYEQNVFDDG